MSRLPTPGSDNGSWGDILNDFLLQSHTSEGTLKADTIGASNIQDGAVSESKLDSATQQKLNEIAPVTSVNTLSGDVVLTATDVGADPAGSAASAQTAAESYADSLVAAGGNASLWLYGPSVTTIPGYAVPAGTEWPTRLSQMLDSPSVTSYAVNGTRSRFAAASALTGAQEPAQPAPIAGSQWDPARQGILILHTMGNDVAGPGAYSSPLTTAFRNSVRHWLRLLIAATAAASRVESSTATGSSWSTFSVAGASGGSTRYTTTANATLTFPAVNPPTTGPNAGVVWLVGSHLASASGTMANIEISVNGSPVEVWNPGVYESWSGGVASYGHACRAIRGVPAGAVISVRHAGSAGQYVYVDCLLVPSVSPIRTLVPETGLCSATASAVPNPAQYNANQPLIADDYQSVCREFGHVQWVSDPERQQPDEYLYTDGLHWSILGHDRYARMVYRAITQNR